MEIKEIEEQPSLFYSEQDAETEKGDESIEGHEKIFHELKSVPLSDCRSFFLKAESYFLQFAYANNKILSLSNSRTRILAHQVESTHRIISALNQRFLVADEVGLGKTIEAGLVLKELVYRYNYKRILIICPASLLYQWQNEMQSKFNENFIIMDRKELQKAEKSAGEKGNPWKEHDRIICSLDFIKNSRFSEEIKNTWWDAVVFDEAHRLRRDSGHATLAYTAAELISKRTKALLMLTATPFRGKLEELYYLIRLLDRNILGPFQTFYNEYCTDNADLSTLRHKIFPVIIRRTKKEVGGFTKRFARTIKFELYEDERELYDKTTKYVIEEFNRAQQTENRAVGFVMTVFQKMLDSSTFALGSSLKRRVKRLSELADEVEAGRLIIKTIGEEDPSLMLDQEQPENVSFISSDKTVDEIRKEIKTIRELTRISDSIAVNKKGEKLKGLLKDLKKRGYGKFLIFTQFRTTQDYLMRILDSFNVEAFNGSMNRDEKEEALLTFKEEADILISTEAGGEGRNMQFCNIIINYDLPWSPLKIEQRIGRLHRFGQEKDVYVYNFSTRGTVAERVLEVLENKLRLFEESIGAPDVLLGQVEDELKLNRLFMEMASGKKSRGLVKSEIEERLEAARKSYEKLDSLTLTDRMDFNYDEYYRITLKERKFSNRRIERFVNTLMQADDYYREFIGERNPKTGLYPVVNDFSGEEREFHNATFESSIALENEGLEFLAFGHPVVDKLVRHCQGDSFKGLTGVRLIDYDLPFTGMVFYYIVTYRSVEESSELVPVVIVNEGELHSYEIEPVENELAQQNFIEPGKDYSEIASHILESADEYFEGARKRIIEKIDHKILDICIDLDLHIDPELDKIRDSYARTLVELEEKLDRQEGKMKWYGSDMKGVITRTKNQIMKAKKEKEYLMKKYRGYYGVKYSVKLLSAGVLISE